MSESRLIAVVTNNDDDIYCFRKELIESIIKAGYRVLISCPYGEKFELMKHIDYIYDNPKIDRRGTNVIKDFGLLQHYKKVFKKYKPDIVLTFTAKPNVYAGMAAMAFKIPYICNVTGLGSVLNKKGLVKKFIFWLFKNAYRNAACLMFQNAMNMKLAIDGKMVRGEYKLIPGSGVDLDRFPLQPYPNGGNGLEGENIVFNYIGRVFHEKGIDDYIEVAKRIKAKYPKTEFNIIGFIEPTESHYKKELQEYTSKSLIFYRGNQKDVKPWIARSHAIIHPSVYGEGISNVLLENASSGRPIITTDNCGCVETVEDSITGLIYPKGNVDFLEKQVVKFISSIKNSTRMQMGLAGRQKVEREFNRANVVKAYLEAINKLLG